MTIKSTCYATLLLTLRWSKGHTDVVLEMMGFYARQHICYVIVRPLSTVEYTSVASVFHCRRGLTNLIHDRRGCTLFTLSSVGTRACLFHAWRVSSRAANSVVVSMCIVSVSAGCR